MTTYAPLLLKRVSPYQVVQHFLDEQRVSVRRITDRDGQLVRWTRDAEASDQFVNLQLVETPERDGPADVLALESAHSNAESLSSDGSCRWVPMMTSGTGSLVAVSTTVNAT